MCIARSSSLSRAISLPTFCALGQELLRLDPRRVDDFEMIEDDLQRSLKDLGLSPHVQKITGLEQASQVLGGVPEPGSHGARLVPQLQVQVEIALPVGPKLLVRDQKRLVDRVAIHQLVDIAAGHEGALTRCSNQRRTLRRPGDCPGRDRL